MTKETEKDWRLGCLSALALMPASCLWTAWVVTRLWSWFVVPQFHMAPLSLTAVIGLNALILLYRHMPSTKQAKEESWSDLWLRALLIPAVALGVGYVAHLFQ